MKLRLVPILSTAIISAALLFGGWYMYQNFMVKNPIQQIADGIPGVTHSEIQSDRNTIDITLQLSNDVNLPAVYEKIRNKSQAVAGERTLTIHVEGTSSDLLDQWWSIALFDVAQSMETRSYGDIPEQLKKHASNSPGLNVETMMDNDNVYVHLSEGSSDKYIVMPRTPVTMGVWPNESIS